MVKPVSLTPCEDAVRILASRSQDLNPTGTDYERTLMRMRQQIQTAVLLAIAREIDRGGSKRDIALCFTNILANIAHSSTGLLMTDINPKGAAAMLRLAADVVLEMPEPDLSEQINVEAPPEAGMKN